MEWEKIIYFYPIWEKREKAGNPPAAKKYWFQEASLAPDEWDADVIGCCVPPFYYRRRAWKPQVLSEAMERVVGRVEGMTDTWVHPQIGMLLTAEYERRWTPRRETVQAVTARLIERYAARLVRECGEVAVLLGEPADTDWQMKMTGELLLPYLPKINKLVIFYEEIAETDIWMELGSHLDEYYYEYGLVPQLAPYMRTYAPDAEYSDRFCAATWGKPGGDGSETVSMRANAFRCGKQRCNGMILDYCGQFRYPKILPDSKAVYIDVMSEGEKERLLGRKTPRIPYISPLKYLDTMVKNSYDR